MPIENPPLSLRMCFDLPYSLHKQLDEVIPWGMKQRFMRALVEDFLKRNPSPSTAVKDLLFPSV